MLQQDARAGIDPAQEAIARWKREMQTRARAYFEGLRCIGTAAVSHHPLRGRTFLDVSIEGLRFRGQVRRGPHLVGASGAECLLTCASITFGPDYRDLDGPAHWAVSQYRTQQRIVLDGLSPEGRRALACTFGLLIHQDAGADTLSESECFVLSDACGGLRRWAHGNPTLAHKLLRDQPDLLRRLDVPEGRPPRKSRYRSIYEFEYLMGS